MNNEPVAYVDNVWINRPDLAMDLGIGQMFSRCQLSDHQIPLYTHPVKEQGNPVAWRSQDPEGYWSVYQAPVEGAEPLYTGFKGLTYADGIEECAQRAEAYAYMSPNFTALAEELRAILRKAQEK